MCKATRKALEWLGMLLLTVYALISIVTSISEILLCIVILVAMNFDLLLVGLGFYGVTAGISIYCFSIACITATVRMVEYSDAVCLKIHLPLYKFVRDLKKNGRMVLYFSHIVQLSFMMAFATNLFDKEVGLKPNGYSQF